ncbi:MAG: fused protease/ribonucleoside-triphosphate reductase [Nanoarchaeota archaeon]
MSNRKNSENSNGKWDWKRELKENRYMGPIQRKIITRLHDPSYEPFAIDCAFVAKYSDRKADFGFNGLGEITYLRTYSRPKPDGKNERWHETVARVVTGTYNLQKRWVTERGLEWSDHKAQESAQEMYERIWSMKFLPPGRGLWAMGAEPTEERGLYAALNNCGFVSTDNIKDDLAKPFTFLMDMSMLGVGVGFDTKGAGTMLVKGPDKRRSHEKFVIPDTRDGWVESVRMLIESNFLGIAPVDFVYDKIRGLGSHINGFGGKSSGPEPLVELHEGIIHTLEKARGRPITSRVITDLENMIGRCVVAGNVRRSAELALGEPEDEEFLDLKNYDRHPERKDFGWVSNNSIFARLGMDYSEPAKRTAINGEPGYAWLENMRAFGRMSDPPNHKDRRVKGANPCVEQSLESYELCNLVETFPERHQTKEDFLRTLKFAYLYAKTVALGESHWPETNRVLLRNRRIGASMSGIAQFLTSRGIKNLREWSRDGYDTIQHYDGVYSDWLTVPKSIKTTSVKPSGSVSLLAGATPGIHYPESEYYIRRIRLGKGSEMIPILQEAGYKIEDSKDDKSSIVVEIPVHVGSMRTIKQVSLWEQVNLAAFMQEHWADNQVSCTASFDPKTEAKEIVRVLDVMQYKLKAISFLPRTEEGAFEQMPYEEITKTEYEKRRSEIKEADFSKMGVIEKEEEKFCSNDHCEIQIKETKITK